MKFRDMILYAMLYGISMLPLRVLYILSDVLVVFVYHLVGYRKGIVLSNLKVAFPEKSEKERRIIAKQFYRNFTDTIIESIKLISSGEALIDKMFVGNLDTLNAVAEKGKNVQIHAMHNFNWEVVNQGVSRLLKRPFLGVYQPITNKFFNDIFMKVRSRFGTKLIPANDFKNNFIDLDTEQHLLALVADQNPGNPAKAWWLNFFGKPAPFVMGPERAARERNTIVVFANFFKVKRGVYSFESVVVTEDPASMREGDLTKLYLTYIQEKIRERPDNYLWSHRRWKHAYKNEYALNCIETLNLS
jgi:KDO2-lipid IV(A) lauroyltransferase